MAKDTIRSPSGQTFRPAGRAGPVAMKPAPAITAEAGGIERLVIKEGHIFVCSRPDGDIVPGFGGDGIYSDDTRYVSEMSLELSGKHPVLLSSSADRAYAMAVALTNPEIATEDRVIPQQTLSVSRWRFVDDRMHERISVVNYGQKAADLELALHFNADFADTFEVRRVTERDIRGELLEPKVGNGGFSFAYVGEDGTFRESVINLSPKAAIDADPKGPVKASWRLKLKPGDRNVLELWILPIVEKTKRSKPSSFDSGLSHVTESHREWHELGTDFISDNDEYDAVLASAVRDLRALTTPINDEGQILVAGIPWFVAPFGRDSLLTSYESLMFSTAPARQALQFLSKRQATSDDPDRDAEPGKILHEIRYGELARAGLIPHTPYFGSVDSTPLFVMLCAAYYRWTHDETTIRTLLPSIERALDWISHYGDSDGDGFVEYQTRSKVGLKNQGWKDSNEAIVNVDGSLAEGPIALAEVQGYIYLAKLRIADVFEQFAMSDRAESLRKEAAELRTAFNEGFWMPDEGSFAMALDGRKNQVRSIASNPGHCLYAGIIDPDKAVRLVERLMAPDMFSGWGIRTLSKDSVAYNPMSYHNGSVWPHDNAIIASGMKRYGFQEETNRIATALFDAARLSSENRLPELYCGFDRRESVPFVHYPVACSPQAWAAASSLMLLQAMLGISARAHEGVLTVIKPLLPPWIRRLEIRRLRVGNATMDISFGRDRERTSVALLGREGDVRVSVEA